MKIEYVVSAVGMIRMHHEELSEHSIKAINAIIKDYPQIALLFNAYTESSYDLKKQYDTNIYADSGGLQITTRNLDSKTVAKEHKKIYKVQANKSHIAMNFDEMPLEVMVEKSTAVNMTGRYFIHSLVEEKAKQSAVNIKEQIEIFDKEGTAAKIMVIGQGNDIKSYNKYFNTIVTQLSDDELKWIHGVAVSGAANGSGGVEVHDMIYGIKDLDIPEQMKKNIHMLGFGTAKRLSPFLFSPEYFDFVDVLSFDSTSKTRLYPIDGMLDLSRGSLKKHGYRMKDIYKEYDFVYDDMKKYLDMHPSFKGMKHLVDNYTYYSPNNKKKVWSYVGEKGDKDLGIFSQIIYTLRSVISELVNVEEAKNTTKPIYSDIKQSGDWAKYRRQLFNMYRLNTQSIPPMLDKQALDKHIQKKTLL